ncbi:MAG: hypothetical protein U0521_24975 [Anaerolineae bacterium]
MAFARLGSRSTLGAANTEDDPGGRQTEARARDFAAATAYLQPHSIPLWVKIS